MLGLGLGINRGGFVGGFDADYQAVLDRGTTLGYALPTGDALTAGDTLVKSLKSGGIWNKLDVFYVFATNGDSDFATLNWKTPASFQATKVNSPTFTSLEGFTGNGTTSYLNTNWAPATNGVNFQLNSAGVGAYIRTNIASGNPTYGARNSGLTDLVFHYVRNLSNTSGGAINSSTFSFVPSADSRGFHTLNRISASSVTATRNTDTATSTSAATAVPNFPIYTHASNNAGTPANFNAHQFSILFAGGNIASEVSDFYTAIQNYMTAIGKEV